jgi:hypothetical protein
MERAPGIELCRESRRRGAAQGYNILILSDRAVDAETASRFRRCWRLPPVHHHLGQAGPAHRDRPGSSRRAKRAGECITSRFWAVTAPRPSIPILAFETRRIELAESADQRCRKASTARRKRQQAATSRRSARVCIKVMSKMGISTYHVLLRRANLRRRRPVDSETSSRSISPVPPARMSKASAYAEVADERRSSVHEACLRGRCRFSRRAGCGRRVSPSAHARRGPYVDARCHREAAAARRARAAFRPTRNMRSSSTIRVRALMTLRGLFDYSSFGRSRRFRSTRSNRQPRYRQAILNRRDVAWLHLDVKRIHARDRDEPHRRQARIRAKAA